MILKNFQNSPNFSFWTEDKIHALHLASLEILERTGVLVYDKEATRLLKDAGAYVKGDLVKIPTWLVEEAISSAPEKITLGNRDGERTMRLEAGIVNYGMGTDLPYFTDPKTKKIRSTTIEDIENIAKIGEYAPNLDFVACSGLAQNVTTKLADLYHFKALRTYCKKPILTTATDYDNMKALIDMAAVSAGGYEELRNTPTLVLYAEPISPLVNSREAVQKLLLCAEYGIPVTYASGIMAGGTGPATIAGSLALGNAEGLAGLVMHQLKRKGAPFIFGLVFSVMDMNTTISCYGGPELPMAHTIVGKLGEYYKLPTYGTSGATDSLTLDAQAGMESIYSVMCAALGGTNMVHDNGYLGAGLVGSLSKILLDDESIAFVKRFMKGIDLSEETLALDIIHKVGPGGNFLLEEHTSKYFRKETWYPRFFNRKTMEIWLREGCMATEQRIAEKVCDLLISYKPERINDAQLDLLEEIIREHEQRVKKI